MEPEYYYQLHQNKKTGAYQTGFVIKDNPVFRNNIVLRLGICGQQILALQVAGLFYLSHNRDNLYIWRSTKKEKIFVLLIGMIMVIASTRYAGAVPTQITVLVKSKDAKFIGSSLGGASVTIRDVRRGKALVEGVTSGGTGNTDRIMTTPKSRGVARSDESSAKFTAMINIDEPALTEDHQKSGETNASPLPGLPE